MLLQVEIFQRGLSDAFLFLAGLVTGAVLMFLISSGLIDLSLAGSFGSGGVSRDSILAGSPFEREVVAAATAEGLDPDILFSIVEIESGQDPMVVSEAGAQGLGQLMPEIQTAFGVDDPFDVEQNLAGSAKFLAHLVGKYDRLDLAIAAYHAGEPLVDGCGCVPRPVDVEYVVRFFEVYRPVMLPYRIEADLVTNGFHGDAHWAGRDYAAECGTPLYAPISGRVESVGFDGFVGPHGANNSFLGILGNGEHAGLRVMLLHGEYEVEVGDRVIQGVSKIGKEASIGNSTGCHTHLIVKYGGRLVDPINFIR